MAQNLNESLLRLELEVIGADAIKAAATAVESYGAATKKLQPAKVETILTAVDLGTPVVRKYAQSLKELAEQVQQYSAMIQNSFRSMRDGSLGLLPSDVRAIRGNERLYNISEAAMRSTNQMGSDDFIVASEGGNRALKATRSIARLAPSILGAGILQNPDYKLIASAAGAAHVDAADLQTALANLAPLMAQQKLIATYRAALRIVAGPREQNIGQHPLFQTQRSVFGLFGAEDPNVSGSLSLEEATLLLASKPQLMERAFGLRPRRRLSPLDLAQRFRQRSFGLTEEEAPLQKLPATRKIVWPAFEEDAQLGPLDYAHGRFLPYVPGETMRFRPRTQDVYEMPAGPMQQRRLLPPTAIETTAREIGPVSPGIASILSTAEAAILQGRGMVPERTALEKFHYAVSQRIRQTLGRFIAPLENELGMATIGRSGGASDYQQAIDLIESHGQSSIFPSVFAKKLNVSREAGQLWINRLQQEGYLGQSVGNYAIPIINAKERLNLTDAITQERLKQARAKTRQAAKEVLEEEAKALATPVHGEGGLEPPEGPVGGGGRGGRGGRGGPGAGGVSPLGRFAGRFAGLSYYLGAAAVLYPVLGALSQADQSAKELQTTIQRIQGIYGSHALSEQLEIKQGIIAAAQKYGENLTEVATAAERFAQAQESIKNIGIDLQTAAAGSRAFGTNMQQIAEFMIGIQEATGGKTTGAQGVNLVAALSRQGVVSPMSLMTAMQQLTPITQELFAEQSGSITDPALIGSILKTVSQRTGMSGTTVTNAMRYMFARFKGPTAGNIEELSGVNLGTLASHGQELKPVAEILRDLAAAYKHLIDTGQSAKATELLTLLFGPRQIGPGATFLENMPKILRDAMEALSDTGALTERAGVQMNTLETSQKKLHNSLTDLWLTNLTPIRTGINNFIADIVNAVSWVIRLDEAHTQYRNKIYSEAGRQLTRPVVPGETIHGIPVPSINPFADTVTPSSGSLSGFDEFVSRSLVGPRSNKPEEGVEGVGNIPSEAIYEKPPLRNIFAQAMVRGQISLQAQMRRAQISAISQQTQTALRLSTMLRQAQGRSTIGLELQGIEAGRVEQREVNQANFVEQFKLYQADYARIAKELKDAQENKKYTVQERDRIIIPLQEERLGINAKIALLFKENAQEQNILDIKTEQTKQSAIQLDQMRQQVEKLKELGQIGQIAQNFITQGLQGVAQAFGTTGPGRGGRAAGAFLGAAAGGLGDIMSRGLDLFGPQGAFPGVGRTLYNKLGRPSEADITAQAKAMAPAIQSRFPGMALSTATELAKNEILKNVNKQQAYQAIGQIGGELAGSIVGGNAQGAHIGSTLGSAAGTLIGGAAGNAVFPVIGGLVGGLIGGLIGGKPKPTPEIGSLKIIEHNSSEQVRLLENTNKLLAANFVSFNVPTGFRLPSYQPGFFGGLAASRGAGGGVVNSSIHVAVNVGGTNVSADKLGSTIAQAISDRLELESRASGNYNPRLLYG